jgi:hypothetical protein
LRLMPHGIRYMVNFQSAYGLTIHPFLSFFLTLMSTL